MNTARISGMFKKELMQTFASPMAWIVMAAYLVVSGYFFSAGLTISKETTLRPLFEQMALMLLLISPLLTMRLFADERRNGSMDQLLSWPITEVEIVLGKYMAVMLLYALMMLFTLQYPVILAWLGNPDPGPLISGYAGLLLLGGCLIAAGVFFSSITDNPIVAAISHFSFIVLLWTSGFTADFLPEPFSNIVQYAATGNHFTDFAKGIIDIRHVLYYLSLTLFFLVTAVKSVQHMRWR